MIEQIFEILLCQSSMFYFFIFKNNQLIYKVGYTSFTFTSKAPEPFNIFEISISESLFFAKSIAIINLSSVLLTSKIIGFEVGPKSSIKKKVNAIPNDAKRTVNSNTIGIFVGKGKKFLPPTLMGQSTPIVQNVSNNAKRVPVIPNEKAATPILGKA